MVTKELQKEEAVARMKYLGLMPEAVQKYTDGELLVSEYNKGILYDADEGILQAVQDFENKFNSVVYHVIKNDVDFGVGQNELNTFLYVSACPEEWEYDREDLSVGRPVAYVYNTTTPEFSDLGSVGIFPINGGLGRNDIGYDFFEISEPLPEINPAALREEKEICT